MRYFILLLVVIGLGACKKNAYINDTVILVECEDCRVFYDFNPDSPSVNKGYFDVKGKLSIPYIKEKNEIKLDVTSRSDNGIIKITYMGEIIYNEQVSLYPEFSSIYYKY